MLNDLHVSRARLSEPTCPHLRPASSGGDGDARCWGCGKAPGENENSKESGTGSELSWDSELSTPTSPDHLSQDTLEQTPAATV